VRRLANRTEWPTELADCRLLPEVKALREALRDDAEPVLVLLGHPKPQVRVAALAALEFRPSWRKDQAEAVLRAAKFATEPMVRVTAMTALANVDQPTLTAAVAVYLRDVSPEVRLAAAEALIWDAERRWADVRRYIHAALADIRCAGDGPLTCPGGLPNAVLADLKAWASESGPIGLRSTKTLVAHYRREIDQNPSPELVDEMVANVRHQRNPSALRVELAHLLAKADGADEGLWRELLGPNQPSSLRLLAAGTLLRQGSDQAAVAALRDVASIPNREITMAVAAIVQRCLHFDMGLPLDGPAPDPRSKQAAEVARRVLEWVAGRGERVHDEATTRRERTASLARQILRPTDELPRRRI
jgi:hypothetical protein